MELLDKLERVFGEPVLSEAEDTVLHRTEWMTSDPELVNKVARTRSVKALFKALGDIAYDVGDQALLDTVSDYEKGDLDPDTAKEIARRAQEEAYQYLPEIVATTPTKSLPTKLRKGVAGYKPAQFLGWTPEQIAQHYQQQREKRASEKVQRNYIGDHLYGIFGPDGNNLHAGPVHGGWKSEGEAELELNTNFQKYENTADYTVARFMNPRSTTALRSGIIPREDGWTKEEVVLAMRPLLYHAARKFLPDIESAGGKVELQDLVQTGYIGVLDAFEKDQGKSPFTAFALLKAKRAMRQSVLTGGTVKGSEKGEIPQAAMLKTGVKPGGAASFRQRGLLTQYKLIWIDKNNKTHIEPFDSVDASKGVRQDPGYEPLMKRRDELKKSGEVLEDPNGGLSIWVQQVRGGARSLDMPVSGEPGAPTLGSQLKGTKIKSPTYIARQRDAIQQLKAKANLTKQQELALNAAFGLDVPEAGLGVGAAKETEPGRNVVIGIDVIWTDPQGKRLRTRFDVGDPSEEEDVRKKAEEFALNKRAAGQEAEIKDRTVWEPSPEAGYYERGEVGERGAEPKMGEFVPTKGREPGKQFGLPAPTIPKETGTPRNPAQIGRILGVSKNRAKQLLSTALLKICKSASAEKNEFCKQVLGLPDEPTEGEQTTCIRCTRPFTTPDKRLVRVCDKCKEAEQRGKLRRPPSQGRKAERKPAEIPTKLPKDLDVAKILARLEKMDPEMLKQLTAESVRIERIMMAEDVAQTMLLRMLFDGDLDDVTLTEDCFPAEWE